MLSLIRSDHLINSVSSINEGNMSFVWGDEDTVKENRKKFFDSLGIPSEKVVVASLVHGDKITEVSERDRGKGVNNRQESIESDILVTSKPDVFLFLVVADCLALFLYEPVKQVCALAHAGWRGLEQEVPCKTIEYMVNKYGCDPSKILAGISPMQRVSTHPHVLDPTNSFWQPYQHSMNDKPGCSLFECAWDQLIKSGVNKNNITDSKIDTIQNPLFFSHRRSELTGETEGRFGCVIGFSK